MGDKFPYLDAKEVYDLLILNSEEWIILKQVPPADLLTKLKRRYRHVHPFHELLERGQLFTLLSQGTSILKKGPKESMGLVPSTILTYALDSLSHTDKTRFGYALRGRRPGEGFLAKLGGRMVGRNSLMIPSRNLHLLKGFLDTWKVSSSSFEVFLPEQRIPLDVDNPQF